MKMIKGILFFIILYSGSYLWAQVSNIDSLIIWGIDQSIRQNYAVAETTFNEIIRRDKNHPRGYFFLAATLQSKMMDYETDYWEEPFLSHLNKTEQYAKELINKNSKDAWAYFYLGSAYSYRAFHDGKKKKYISAFRYGMSGISSLNKVIEIDSTMYDVYFGIGSYKYWRSKFTRYFNWLPLLNDEREIGINMVKLAAQSGRFTNYAAINALIWILIDNRRVTEALKWSQMGLQKYPYSRFFLWGTAKSYYNLQQFEKALNYYETILASIQQEKINNHYNEIICYFKIAQCYFNLRQYEKALNFCEYIFSIELTLKVKHRLNEIINKVKSLREKILQEKS